MVRNILVLVIVAFLLMACNPNGDDEKDAKAQIVNIIREIEYTFNNTVQGGNDVSSIMKYYSEDYRHNGANKMEVNNRWVTRAREYSSMRVEVIDVYKNYIDDNRNVVLTTYFYSRSNNNPVLDIYNDFSVFSDEDGGWKIIGNGVNISIGNQ